MQKVLKQPFTGPQRAQFIYDAKQNGLTLTFKEDKTTGEELEIYAHQRFEKVENGVIINISNTPEYIAEKAKEREDAFNKDFFETSAEWVKRTVTMQDGTIKNFLTDIYPSIAIVAGQGQGLPPGIIRYKKPKNFENDLSTKEWEDLQIKGAMSPELANKFIEECTQRLLADFAG